MKRLNLLFSLLLLLAPSLVSAQAITFVTSGQTRTDAGAATIACPSQVLTGGNTMIVMVANESSIGLTSITDGTNTYVIDGTYSNGTGRMRIAHSFGVTGGTFTITANFASSADFRRISCQQYSAAGSPTWAFQDTGTGTGTGTAMSTANSAATSVADAVIVAFSYNSNTNTKTAGASFTLRGTGVAVDSAFEDRIVTATGTYNALMTIASSETWSMFHGIYTSAAAAGGATARRLTVLGVGP